MFEAPGYVMTGDGVDLSFRDTDRWPKVGPGGFTRSLWVSIGDPVSGPAAQLVATDPINAEVWLAAHYHGSDQFRVTLHGDLLQAKRHLGPGDFSFLESGRAYVEGAGLSPDGLWAILLMGTRRGARTTYVRGDDDEALPIATQPDNQLDKPLTGAADPYWAAVPGGAKGIPALASTVGPCERGYIWGSFSELAEGGATALLGDAECGPAVMLVTAGPGEVVQPAAELATEVLWAVVSGSCHIGGAEYAAGDARVQRAGSSLGEVISGSDGVCALHVVADRRALSASTANGDLGRWATHVDELTRQLEGAR